LVCPEGALELVPVEAMVAPSGRFVIEDHVVSYLTTGRDLLAGASESPPTGGAVIVADPDFDAPLPASQPATSAAPPPVTQPAFSFQPLPGTRREAEQIARLLNVDPDNVLTGPAATKSAFMRLHSPRVLHVATHGFLLPAGPRTGTSTRPDADRAETSAGLNDALLRSGLALAGANRPGPGDPTRGILTAMEVSGLSLQGTDLVVLSACETGLGVGRRGEGLFGLRRSFLQAGAKSIVTSLWKVSDADTIDLMAAFYGGWRSGRGKADALRSAQLKMIGDLRARSDGWAHPFFWAGFILVGQWQ